MGQPVYMVRVTPVIQSEIVHASVLTVGKANYARRRSTSVTLTRVKTMLPATTNLMIFFAIVLLYQVKLVVNFVKNK
jgi:hypothetical protein